MYHDGPQAFCNLMKHKYLRVCIAVFTLALLMAGALQAASRAEKLYRQGQAAEGKQNWDEALDLYQQALDQKPGDAQYAIAMRRARFQAGQMHVNLGEKLRAQGKLEESLGEFQKALIADPGSAIAIQEIKRTQGMIERDKTKSAPKPEDRGLTPAEEARRESNERVSSIMAPPELKPIVRQVGPLKINNQQPKVLYETIGKLAGVNVLFDSQYAPPQRGYNVDLGSASRAEQAFDYLAVLTHTFWKPVSTNAIFVTEDNPTKHRDYDDGVPGNCGGNSHSRRHPARVHLQRPEGHDRARHGGCRGARREAGSRSGQAEIGSGGGCDRHGGEQLAHA